MTLDDLINEGKIFKIRYVEAHLEPAGFGMAKQIPGYYYLKNGNIDEFHAWAQKCKRFLALNYPNDISSQYFDNEYLKNISDKKLAEMIGALKALKEMPTVCEHKNPIPQSVQNINVNQTQTVIVDIVIEALKEEIGKQGLNTLKDVSGETKEEITKNVFAKLKTFGIDTLSNIMANIVTNPAIWPQI